MSKRSRILTFILFPMFSVLLAGELTLDYPFANSRTVLFAGISFFWLGYFWQTKFQTYSYKTFLPLSAGLLFYITVGYIATPEHRTWASGPMLCFLSFALGFFAQRKNIFLLFVLCLGMSAYYAFEWFPVLFGR